MKNTDKEYFKVVRYETKTGIILDANNERCFEAGKSFRIFDDEEEAKKYVHKNLLPGKGFYILDKNEKMIYENIYDELIANIDSPKKWWQFWRQQS
jgi:hypothetical protein